MGNTQMNEPIGILGHSLTLPLAIDAMGEEYFRILSEKQVLKSDLVEIGRIKEWAYSNDDPNPWLHHQKWGHLFPEDIGMDDTTLLRLSEKELKFMAQQQLLALTSVWKALENCGLPVNALHKTATGVFVAGYAKFGGFESYPDETALRGGMMSSLADRVSYFLGTHGPSVTLETACSSSLVAITLAANSIKDGTCDVAIVLGINMMFDEYEFAFQAMGVVSPTGECRPFCEKANGTVRCEGICCIVLCSMNWANEHQLLGNIDCMVLNATLGSAGADPNAKQGSGRQYEAPNAYGIERMIRLCHSQIQLPLSEVCYVAAHATGAPVGDLVELAALRDVYQSSHDVVSNPLRVGSIKGNIGHAEVASGLFSMIAAVEMIKRKTFLPTGGKDICPRLDFDWNGSNMKLCLENEPFPSDKRVCIGVNSFGVGGAYAHVILSEYPEPRDQLRPDSGISVFSNGVIRLNDEEELMPLIFSISAASTRHLEEYEKRVLHYLKENRGSISLLDICGCFAINRSRLNSSRHYLVHSIADLEAQLSSPDKLSESEGHGHATVAMIFTGQGSQWQSMGERLMVFDAYRKCVSQFDALYRKLSGWSPISKLGSLDENTMNETMYAQPLTFMLQVGLINLFKYFGIVPTVVLGHSAGEIAALYCCGALSLEQAARVVYYRSSCQQRLAGTGRMLAIQMNKKDCEALLKTHKSMMPNCQIACINSPASVVIGGPEEELQLLKERIPDGAKSTFLKGRTPFHTASMDLILEEVDNRLSFFAVQNISNRGQPLVSTVTGKQLDRVNREYFVHNIRMPVKFQEGMQFMLGRFEPDVVLEIGPHPTLTPLVVECMEDPEGVEVMSTLRRKTDDLQSFWGVLHHLLGRNVAIDFRPFLTDLGYCFSTVSQKNIPGHPIFQQRKPKLICEDGAQAKGRYDVGPAAGTRDSPFVSRVEISKQTCMSMTEHVMGGMAILPGMYFVEAAIENHISAHGKSAIVMCDVRYGEICPIPDRSKNQETRSLFVRESPAGGNGMTTFSVESRPVGGNQHTQVVTHCSGLISSFDCPENLDGESYVMGKLGFRERKGTVRDIGPNGIRELLQWHGDKLDSDQFYNILKIGDQMIHGPSFRVIKNVYTNSSRSSAVAFLEFDQDAWRRRGGAFGIQLLDGIVQLPMIHPLYEMSWIGYAGGFDYALFARQPVGHSCIAKFEFSRGPSHTTSGNAWLYDSEGRLLLYLEGVESVRGLSCTRTIDCIKNWQPMSVLLSHSQIQSALVEPGNIMSRVSGCIFSMLHLRPCIRVLEFWDIEAAGPLVFQSLVGSKGRQKDGSIIEYFIATSNPSIARNKAFRVPFKHKSWLRVRILLLPSAQDALDQFCFDVIAVWNKGRGAREAWDTGPQIKELAILGAQDCILFHDFDRKTSGGWEKYVTNEQVLGEGVGSCIIQRDMIVKDKAQGTDILVLCLNSALAERFSSIMGSVNKNSHGKVTAVVGSWSSSLDEQLDVLLKSEDENAKHVVVLDGIEDESEYAKHTFVRVANLGRTLGARVQSLNLSCKPTLWVVASNVNRPPIRMDRCSLPPLVGTIQATYSSCCAKFVDIESTSDCLESVALLIMHNYGAWQYLVARPSGSNAHPVIHQSIMMPCDTEKTQLHTHGTQMISAFDSDRGFKYDRVFRNFEEKYEFTVTSVRPPRGGEVLVQVHASSLNFRDVMLTLGAMPKSSFEGSFFGRNVGMECSGIIVDVGEGVCNLKKGDHVIVFEPGCFASKITTSETRVQRFDASAFGLTAAAALSSVYCTAYYALVDLSNIKKGERVLIHAVAGGVGHAAVSICQHLGAEIFATASLAKQQYCTEMLCIPDSHVFDSRSVTWFEDLLHATSGEGVDVVLNSLAGEHQRLGLEALRPGGRFCEIGKMDIYNNEPLPMYLLRKNIRIFAIDMDRMQLEAPDEVQRLASRVCEHASRGDFSPIPTTTFGVDKIEDAIEYMKSGAHVGTFELMCWEWYVSSQTNPDFLCITGKVVVTNFAEGGRPLSVAAIQPVQLDPEQYVLILGGAGGFGSQLIGWAYWMGARKFITTVSRDASRVTEKFKDLIKLGVEIKVIVADLSKEEDLEKIENYVINHAPANVETLIHCAGIYEAFHFEEVHDGVLDAMSNIKVRSALFLHNLSLKIKPVKHFILVGSTSSEFPAAFVASYGATNCMLEGLSRYRESMGLPSTILHMTSIKDAGIVFNDKSIADFQKSQLNMELIPAARAVTAIHVMIETYTRSLYHVCYSHFDAKSTNDWNGAYTTPAVEGILVFGQEEASKDYGAYQQSTYEEILEMIIHSIKDLFSIEDDIGPGSALQMIGIDSLGIMELRQYLLTTFGYAIDRSAISMSLNDLAKSIMKHSRERAQMASEEDIGQDKLGTLQSQVVITEESHQLAQARNDSFLRLHNHVEHPIGYLFALPGLDRNGIYFTDWRASNLQIVVVQIPEDEENPSTIAKAIAQAMHEQGYLKLKIAIMGYSFGSLVGLELCKELRMHYSCTPVVFIPCMNPGPHLRLTKFQSWVPSQFTRQIKRQIVRAERRVARSYEARSAYDEVSKLLQAVGLTKIVASEDARRSYYKLKQKQVNSSSKPYIGNIPIHYIYGTKDPMNNQCEYSESQLHAAWAPYTSGPTQVHAFHSGHFLALDEYLGSIFFEEVANIATEYLVQE